MEFISSCFFLCICSPTNSVLGVLQIFSFRLTFCHSLLQVGLDGAGKTTILYKLKLGDVQHTVPTIGKSFLV